MKLTATAKGELLDTNYNDVETMIEIGDVVEYCAHLPGGNVAIRKNGEKFIAHPGCFKELR